MAVMTYVYVSWFASDDFKAVPTGNGPVPSSEKTWAWILQISFPAISLVTIAWAVRGCLRERRFTFDAKLIIGFASMAWLDPGANFLRQQFFFNSYYFNRGSWLEHIPGWISPNARFLPVPLLLYTAYLFMILASILGCAVMRRARARWPRISTPGLLVVAFVPLAVFEFFLENLVLIRTGAAAWTTGVPSLTVWFGTRWQQPLTECVFYGALLTAMTALRFFRDDQGRSVVERGIERLKVRPQIREAISVVAIVGFANVAILLYGLAMGAQSLYLGATNPHVFPGYLRNSICGPGTPYECPAPNVPIVLPH